MIGRPNSCITAFLLCVAAAFVGCSGDDLVPPNPYLDQTSQANVLYNLRMASTTKDAAEYGQLLADDFRFYGDSETRIRLQLPAFWNRTEDSTAMAVSLFKSAGIQDIRLAFRLPAAADSVSDYGRQRWTRMVVYADMQADAPISQFHPEGITYYFNNQAQIFYFRKGRNPADTLAASPTSQRYFLVEWHDIATSLAAPQMQPGAVATITWTGMKTLAWKPDRFRIQFSEEIVLANLKTAYIERNPKAYANVLADDFRFYFDLNTRQMKPELPEFWNRTQDSTGTALSLLASQKISDIRLSLRNGTATPVTDPGRERWTRIISYADLEADQKPDPGMPEGITFLIWNQMQYYYFRKGRNPADTLATSPTSQQFFLVEWQDRGGTYYGQISNVVIRSENTTWSNLKSMYSGR